MFTGFSRSVILTTSPRQWLSTVSAVLRTLGKQTLLLKYNKIVLDKHAWIYFTNADRNQTSRF